jgi:hypothetical protein
MSALVIQAWLGLDRLQAALRRRWRRILAGSVAGWLLASVAGAFALVALERSRLIDPVTSDMLGIAIPLLGVGLGALVGHATAR